MPETNINWILLKDEKVVEQLGKELRRMRLSKNLSQADVAKNAGLDRTTVVKLEAGRAATLLTVVQILRAMDRLDAWISERHEACLKDKIERFGSAEALYLYARSFFLNVRPIAAEHTAAVNYFRDLAGKDWPGLGSRM